MTILASDVFVFPISFLMQAKKIKHFFIAMSTPEQQESSPCYKSWS